MCALGWIFGIVYSRANPPGKTTEIGGGHVRDGSDTDEQESEDSRAEEVMFNFNF